VEEALPSASIKRLKLRRGYMLAECLGDFAPILVLFE
jgi:hypothetical protein